MKLVFGAHFNRNCSPAYCQHLCFICKLLHQPTANISILQYFVMCLQVNRQSSMYYLTCHSHWNLIRKYLSNISNWWWSLMCWVRGQSSLTRLSVWTLPHSHNLSFIGKRPRIFLFHCPVSHAREWPLT